MKGIEIQCIAEPEDRSYRRNWRYSTFNIGETYLIFDRDGSQLGTIKGQNTFNKLFRLLSKNTGTKKKRKRRRKKPSNNNTSRLETQTSH